MAAMTDMDRETYMAPTGTSPQLFRPNLRWTTESYNALKRDVSEKKPLMPEMQYKIALFGATQSGKSSLINTWLSAMRGQYAQIAHSAPAQFSVTKNMGTYPIRLPGRVSPILLCDTMGYEQGPEDDQWLGPNMKDVEFILDGQIDDGYKFDELGISYKDMKQFESKTKKKVNLVVIVWDAIYVSNPTVVNRLKSVMKLAEDRQIACCVLVTKVDKCSEAVDNDLTQVFSDDKVLEAMEIVREKLEIEMSNIFPLQNYTPQNNSGMAINCLALHTLTSLLDMADITLERQHGLPEDHVTRLLEEPWGKIEPGKRTAAVEDLNTIVSDALEGRAITNINIAVLGLRSSGKSQFINALLSALHGKPKHDALIGRNQMLPITKSFRGYQTPLQIKLYDTMGMAETDKQGIHLQDLQAAIEGHIPEGTVFNVLEPCLAKVPNPELGGRMHVAVFVIDGSSFPNLTAEELSLLRDTYHKISDMGVPCVAAVSHLDKVCQHVQVSAANMFLSAETKDCIQTIRDSDLCVPFDDILPVITLSSRMQEEPGSEEARYALLLHALSHACDRAKDYIERQPRPPTANTSALEKRSILTAVLAVFAVCTIVTAIVLQFIQTV